MSVRSAVLVLAPLAAACGPSLDRVVERYQRDLGLSFADCGAVIYTGDPAEPACAAPTPEEQCLLDAFAHCEPAELSVTTTTVEGDPIVDRLLVVPGAVRACTVESFVDSSADAYKGDHGDIVHSSCATVEDQDRGDGCIRLVPLGCTVVEEW